MQPYSQETLGSFLVRWAWARGAACSLVSSTGPGLLRLDQGSGPQLVRGDVASHCSGQWLQAGAGSLYDLLQSAGCSSSTCAPQRLSALAAAFRDLPSAQASFWAAVLPCLPKGRYAAPFAYALALSFIVDLPQARRQSHGCVSALWRPVRSISKRLSCFGALRVLRLCFVQRTSIYLFCAAAGAARACRCVVEAGVSRAPAAFGVGLSVDHSEGEKGS